MLKAWSANAISGKYTMLEQFRPGPVGMPGHGTKTVDIALIVPRATELRSPPLSTTTGPPLSPLPTAALPCTSAPATTPVTVPYPAIEMLIPVLATLMSHTVPENAPDVQTKSPTRLLWDPRTGDGPCTPPAAEAPM